MSRRLGWKFMEVYKGIKNMLSLWRYSAVADQKHLRCTIPGPLSSYSSFVIHISWNVLSDDRMDPPIQTEYFRSGGATIFTFTADGASAVISLFSRLSMPGNMVDPPERTVFVYRSRRMSTSHFWIES